MYKYQLPKEFATKWVAALRGGEYKQMAGKFYSSETGCYCVLGVGYKVNGCEFDDMDLPKFNIDDPIHGDFYKRFLVMNDELKLSFTQIADWIEANVEFVEGEVSHV